MVTIIAAILSIAIAVAGAWIVYRIFNEKNGPTVGPFRFIEAVSERKDANMGNDIIKLKVGLPEGSHDIVGGELTVKRADDDNGRLPAEQTIKTSMKEVEFEAVQDTKVTLSYVGIDDSDNRSEPKEITFTVKDTIAPELSGDFSITAIDERPAEAEGDPASSDDDSAATGEVGPDELGAAEADAEEGEPTGWPAAETEAAAEADARADEATAETETDAEGESEPETTPGD